MQLADLAAFLAVATDRSFSAAARRLNRTQPAISQAVRRLEDTVGERQERKDPYAADQDPENA